jgi:hypothetical protein
MTGSPYAKRIIWVRIQPRTMLGKALFVLCFLALFITIFLLSLFALLGLLGIAVVALTCWLALGRGQPDRRGRLGRNGEDP